MTDISRIRDIPDDARKIIIMRFMPKSLKDAKYSLEWMPELAPTDILLNNYKRGSISFFDFKEEFEEYLEYNKLAQKSVEDIKKDLLDNKDVYLICCEKNHFECHRRFVRKHICDNIGYNFEGGEMQ